VTDHRHLVPYAFTAPLEGAGRDVLRFVARQAAVDGIAVAEVDLSRYLANPVVLWGHDDDRPAIGRGHPFVDAGRLLVDVTFDLADPFAAEVDRKLRAGFLHALSCGYTVPALTVGDDGKPAEGQRWQLHEVSVVNLPRDPDALIVRSVMT
jgi:phage head maturation protease